MKARTINISVPPAMAEYVEQEVATGAYASVSDFFRTLIRRYQAESPQQWADRHIATRLASARDEHNLMTQADLERELLG